jgi:hypothetical protein
VGSRITHSTYFVRSMISSARFRDPVKTVLVKKFSAYHVHRRICIINHNPSDKATKKSDEISEIILQAEDYYAVISEIAHYRLIVPRYIRI